ncbi:unnamed protein product, partial [Larinioides sclopetarius]
ATSTYNRNIPPPSTPPEQEILYIPDHPEEEVLEKTGVQDNLSFQEEETEINVEQSTGTSSSSSYVFPPTEKNLAITLLLLIL